MPKNSLHSGFVALEARGTRRKVVRLASDTDPVARARLVLAPTARERREVAVLAIVTATAIAAT